MTFTTFQLAEQKKPAQLQSCFMICAVLLEMELHGFMLGNYLGIAGACIFMWEETSDLEIVSSDDAHHRKHAVLLQSWQYFLKQSGYSNNAQ